MKGRPTNLILGSFSAKLNWEVKSLIILNISESFSQEGSIFKFAEKGDLMLHMSYFICKDKLRRVTDINIRIMLACVTVYRCVYMSTCVCTGVYMSICECTYVCMYTCIYTGVCMYMHIYVHDSAHVNILQSWVGEGISQPYSTVRNYKILPYVNS